jgi:hemin uptake protein HemP
MNDGKKDINQENKTGYGETHPPDPLRVVRFEDLSHGDKEVMVEYENQHYRLRVTKNGKLILNK